MKWYSLKVYTFAGVYKKTIDPKVVMTDISFASNINWWQGELQVNLALNIDDTSISAKDFIKVYCFDESNPSWRLIYTGQITQITKNYTSDGQKISITALWLYAFMNTLFFKSGANYIFAKNQDPAQTIKDVIDYFNTIYSFGWVWYTTGIENYWSSLNVWFDYTKCNTAIDNCQILTDNFWFYFGADWDCKYKQKTTATIDHYFTLEKDIDNMDITEDVESLTNNVMVDYVWGVANASNGASQTEYWLREFKLFSQAQDIGTWNAVATNYISENKDQKRQTVITINSQYDLESLKPWDYVKIRNSDYILDWVQIQKLIYRYDKVICYLDQYTTLPQAIQTLSNN